MVVDAVVLAGGDGEVIDPAARFKGLVPVAGKPMVERVVDALLAAETISEVAVVAPTAEDLGAWADKPHKLVVSDKPFIDNVLAGIDAFRAEKPVLVTTGDLPALTPEAIDDYVNRSLAAGADFSYPLVAEADMLAQFPGSKRTFLKIDGGNITGGNMMLLAPRLVANNRDLGQRLFETRKSPIKMAQVIGFRFIVKLLTGRLLTSDLERKMGELLGGRCAAIYTSHASIGADVDKPIDVVVAERVLYQREHGRID